MHSDASENAKRPALEQFFSDPEVLKLLAHPFKAFQAPSPQTRATFETKTSAINVTPSSDTRYNIKEVKGDALWLSNEAKIDEITALRIVVEECQDRPTTQLLGRLSNEELASIQEAAGTVQASTASLLDSNAIQEDFDLSKSRQQRILSKYLSERRHLLQCLNIVCQKTLYSTPEAPRDPKGKAPQVSESWVQVMGGKVLSAMGDQDRWIVEAISAIEINAGNLSSGSGWFKEDGGCQDIGELSWERMRFCWSVWCTTASITSPKKIIQLKERLLTPDIRNGMGKQPINGNILCHGDYISDDRRSSPSLVLYDHSCLAQAGRTIQVL